MTNNLKASLLFICSVILVTLIWDYVEFPFDKASLLTKYDNIDYLYNPLNDPVRFILYLTIPFLITIFYYQKTDSLFFKNLKLVCFYEKNLKNKNYNEVKELNFFTFFVFVILIFEFLTLDFKNFNHLVDIFHEGMWLSASQNLKLSSQYWQSSFIAYGFFADFYPYFLWEIFNKESVGITRFFQLIIILLNKTLILLIIKKISLSTNFPKKILITFFLALCAIILPLQAYVSPIFAERSFLYLLFIFVFLNFLQNYNNSFYYIFLLGIFSSASSFWYLDISVYINSILIILLAYFFIKLEIKNIVILFFSILFGWFIFFLIFPIEEFLEFLNDTYSVMTTLSWYHGLKFPTPFISLDARSSKSIMLFLVTGLFIINLINYYKKDRSLFIVVSILLYLSSLLYFNYGLNRSDSGHIRGASSFIFIPFISILLFFLFEKFNSISQKKIKYFNNLNFLLILIILVNTLFFEKKYEQKKITNIFTSKESALRLINYTDDSFISLKHRKFINYYKELTITDKCVFIFTNEVGLSYFLKKQSCSKHYFMFTSAPKKIQDELIGDIKNKKPKFIIYNSKKDNFYNSDIMLKTVNKFILNNYIFFKKFDDWDIYKIQ